MEKRLLYLVAAMALMLGSAAPTFAQKVETQNRFLVKAVTLGSQMGDMPEDLDSKRVYYYYNTDGKLVGSSTYGRNYTDGGYSDTFSLTDIEKIVFDVNGNMTNKDFYQYGDYDDGDNAFHKTQNCESYTYDAQGRLATDTTSMRINEYTYNDDGTLLKVTSYNKRTKKLVQEITYTYENGQATHYSSTGQYYEFEADLKYDADGNKIEEYQYAKSGENVKPRQRETWTFTDGVLTLYMKYRYDSKGAEVADSKEVFVPVENNMNVMDVTDYTYNSFKDTWNKMGLTVRQTYRDFSGMKEATQTMLLSATPDKKLKNTINLQFTAPKAGLVHGCKFVVYRDCVALDTLNLADVMDPATKQCSYQDKELKSDTYTYFVQPLFALTNGEISDATAGSEWVGYYTSTPMDVNVALATELPAVTDLKLVGGEVKRIGSIMSQLIEYYADLEWKNPANLEELGFVRNDVAFVGMGLSDTKLEGAAESARVQIMDDEMQVYVITTYKYGKAYSDAITVTVKDIEKYNGVESVTADGVVKATFAGNTVQLSDAANVSVYSAAGAKVYAKQNTCSVALGQLPAATYIVCVEKDGKSSFYKYGVK
uniref:hypothetical protein n=1 Tax=Prevotella sp. TaxID=59823 RepID=UPI00402873F5